jgi:hypothetical protein
MRRDKLGKTAEKGQLAIRHRNAKGHCGGTNAFL